MRFLRSPLLCEGHALHRVEGHSLFSILTSMFRDSLICILFFCNAMLRAASEALRDAT